MPTYYEILGVPSTATDDEIRSRHRDLVRELHPDVNPSPTAQAQFLEVQDAYRILSDPVWRRRYDRQFPGIPGIPERRPRPGQPRPGQPDMAITCSLCGKRDHTLRYVRYHYVFGILVLAFRRGGSILCESCRAQELYLANFHAVHFGWWGIPASPLIAFAEVAVKRRESQWDRAASASLLCAVAAELLQQGELEEAHRAVRESRRLAPSREARELARTIRDRIDAVGLVVYDPIEWSPEFRLVCCTILLIFLGIVIAMMVLEVKDARSDPTQFPLVP